MENYLVKIEILSETIFGSGQSVPGTIDLELVFDEIGLPYMKGKTFKGNLRREAERLAEILGEEYKTYVKDLFGVENDGLENWKRLKFSDCEISKDIKTKLKDKISREEIKVDEIKYSLTDIRTYTSIDETGSAEEGSLRNMRVIKKGLEYEVNIFSKRELKDGEKGLLAGSISMLRNMGTMKTRGKGEINCKLYKDNKDITEEYIKYLIKE